MNSFILALIAIASCNFLKAEIERLDSVTKPWEHTTYEENIFKDWTERDIKSLLTLKDDIFVRDEPFLYVKAAENFDSRTQWPSCVHAIRDQSNCGSCWAHATSEVFSDRACIEGIDTNFVASVQQLVSCDTADSGCDGGMEYNAFKYIESKGIVADSCYPYVSGNGKTYTCDNNKISACSVHHYGKNTKSISSSGIMAEIKANGPVTTGFMVYADFMTYKSGIYVPTSSQQEGLHAVKIVGYGNSNGIDFWSIANSWGTSWGESGFFRIKMGSKCNIESRVYSIQVAK
jgi:cathepsin B